MSGLYSDSVIAGLKAGAAGLLGEWGLSDRTEVTLLNISENATFRADDPDRAEPVILRVHRPGYHTRDEIASELAWLAALRADGVATIAPPLPLVSGGEIAGFDHEGDHRHVVAFAFAEGAEPDPSQDLRPGFRQLGAISARLHGHVRGWTPPPWFTRKTWDFETTVGARPHWGDWRAGLGLTPDGKAVLERLATRMKDRLAAFGAGPERFGLIHADLRLANLLVNGGDGGGEITVIDFDDCGFGWFAFDFAAAISFIEDDPAIPDLLAAWLEGYREVAPLDAQTEAEIPTFVMLRRLQLTAWLASHAETPTAQELGTGFTDGTVALADAYLSRM